MSKNPYDFFDDIVCINLETVPERRAYAQEVFDRLDIPARFFTAKKHPKGGRYGCFDSHVQVIRQAYDSGVKHLLVFEDDILPTPSYSQKAIAEAIHFMQTNTEWDIFYPGYIPFQPGIVKLLVLAPTVPGFPSMIEFGPFGTHALCYNRRSMKKILDSYQKHIDEGHYDKWLAENLDLHKICYVPMLFDQTTSLDSSIPAHSALEWVARQIWPWSAKYNLLYKITLWKYYLNTKHDILLFWIIIISILLFVFFSWNY